MFQLESMQGQMLLSRNPVCREGLMGEMNTKEAGLAILAGIRVLDAATEEEDPDMEMLLLCMPQAY